MKIKGSLTRALACALLVSTTGCGDSGGPYSTLTGEVTHNGRPVNDATVILTGTTKTQGDGPAAEFITSTDSSGKFVISVVGEKPGIPPGMYKVAVTKMKLPKGMDLDPEAGMDMGQLEAAGMDDGGSGNQLPDKYSSPESSGLSVTLAEGPNTTKFNLKGR